MRSESLNFVHDVNALRKTLKSVYASSADLQALNSEIDELPKNCRIQVLPICWRHRLDFPKKGRHQNRQEHDVSEALIEENDEYPSLESITVEGIPFVRSLITDLALDILLYQSAIYNEHISRICVEEANRVYHLFRERNPGFNGKVHLLGHSLGSAIFFDLISRSSYVRKSTPNEAYESPLSFDFEVEDFYALGSPIGLFQMLKGRTIAATSPGSRHEENVLEAPFPVSCPRVAQLYNITHPTDPVYVFPARLSICGTTKSANLP